MPATLNAGVFNVEIKDKNTTDEKYLFQYLKTPFLMDYVSKKATGGTIKHLNQSILVDFPVVMPNKKEQTMIGDYFQSLDHLITLHQCELTFNKWRISMLNNINKTDLFYEYYAQWITVYKEGAIRKVTMDKYLLTLSWIKQLAPDLKVGELSRITYQQLLNDYAEKHERQTTMDFHHQIKGAILDAVDEGLIERDPTRKAIIKGKKPRQKKIKYLNQFELHKLLSNLTLGEELNWGWFILLVAKTGMRFSELLSVDQETVRRWIRDKKLKADMPSRKEGSQVREDDLYKYLSSTAKYAGKAALLAAANPALAAISLIGVGASGVASAVMALYINEKKKNPVLSEENVVAVLEQGIDECQKEITQKLKARSQIDEEIATAQTKLETLQELMRQVCGSGTDQSE